MTPILIVLGSRPDTCGVFYIFVLALADGLSCTWLVCPIWCWYRCPEIGTSSIDWAQLSRFYLKTETESSLGNVVFLNKKRAVF
jgi:hypothetical protein